MRNEKNIGNSINAAGEAAKRLANARRAQKIDKSKVSEETAKTKGVSPDGGQVNAGEAAQNVVAFHARQLNPTQWNDKQRQNLLNAMEAHGLLLSTEGPEAVNTDKELGKIINLNTHNVGGVEDEINIGEGPEAIMRNSEEDQNIVNFYAKRQEEQQKKDFMKRLYDASQKLDEGEGPSGGKKMSA